MNTATQIEATYTIEAITYNNTGIKTPIVPTHTMETYYFKAPAAAARAAVTTLSLRGVPSQAQRISKGHYVVVDLDGMAVEYRKDNVTYLF